MKSVLVIDTPTRCDECQLCYDKWFCLVTENKIEKIDDEDDLEYECPIPSWCPLRPLPSYKDIKCEWKNVEDVWVDGANHGHNACLDEITGWFEQKH